MSDGLTFPFDLNMFNVGQKSWTSGVSPVKQDGPLHSPANNEINNSV